MTGVFSQILGGLFIFSEALLPQQSIDGLPVGEYLAPLQPLRIDTLMSVDDVLGSVPGWDRSRMGADVRYVDRSDGGWQITILADSTLLVFSESDTVPLVCPLENEPAAFSMSRSGSFALVYHQIAPSDTARYMSAVDLIDGSMTEFMVAQGSNFLQSSSWEGMVTDDGRLSFRTEFNGQVVATCYTAVNGTWLSGEAAEAVYTDPFTSQAGDQILLTTGRLGYSAIHVLTTDYDSLFSFDPGRAQLEPLLSNSGEAVIFSSDLGISVYHRESGVIDSDLFGLSTCIEPPVISASDRYWACTYHYRDQYTAGPRLVYAGRVDDTGQNNELLVTDRYVRPLAVSDQGDVLCSVRLSDPRFYMAYRYVVLNYNGKIRWASEVMYPPFFSPKLSGNAHLDIFACRPRLIDIAPDGESIILLNDGYALEYRFGGLLHL